MAAVSRAGTRTGTPQRSRLSSTQLRSNMVIGRTLGTAGGPGLPCDADTSATAILTAHRLGGKGPGVAPLRHYETGTHFVTWAGERTPSTSTNAHVLDCLAQVDGDPAEELWRRQAMRTVSTWLCDHQRDDGTWADKWHASPLYATAAAAGALRRCGGRGAPAAVARSITWLIDCQRGNGSWGVWGGTAEETAYALQLIVPVLSGRGVHGVPRHQLLESAARGLRFLRARTLRRHIPEHPPLWHDKDLYTPSAVVDAAVVGALHLAESHPAVARAAGTATGSRT